MSTPEPVRHRQPQRQLEQSSKLQNVLYEIRGPVHAHAARLEAEGHRILKLNIGNPAPFGFDAPDVIMRDMIAALPYAQGYSESKGILSARRAIVTRYELVPGFPELDVDDIYLGNGVSELITMTMQALLNNGDEVLIPAPDYPLWTAMTSLSGGTPVHYLCDEANDWNPDIADIESKITDKTKALLVINPNNPTGAVYSMEVLQQLVDLARKHQLLLLADEIYDKILYDDAKHISLATLAPDLLCLTFNGLSKAYRVAGYRSGWVAITGPKDHAGRLPRGTRSLGVDPSVPQRPRTARHSGRPRRSPEHRRPDPARRPPARAARRRLGAIEHDSGRFVCEASRRALRVPSSGSERLRDPRRREVGSGPTSPGEDPDGSRHRVQLAESRSPSDRHPSVGPRSRRGHRAIRQLPHQLQTVDSHAESG